MKYKLGTEAVRTLGKIKNRKTKTRIFICCMLAWAIIHFLVFWLYINFRTLWMTMFRFNIVTGKYDWWGFNNFFKLIKNFLFDEANGGSSVLHNGLINSLMYFPVSNFIILPLSFVLSYFLYKKIPLSNMFRVVFFLPNILSIVILTMSYKFMFDSEFGPIDLLLRKLSVDTPNWFGVDSPTAMRMVFVFVVWMGLGANIILLNGAIARVPKDIYESAMLDGVKPLREMISIVFPLVCPTISTLFILNTIGIFGFMIQPMLLLGETGGIDGKMGTVAMFVFYLTKSGYSSDAASIGVVFSILGIPVIMFIKYFIDKITPDIEF